MAHGLMTRRRFLNLAPGAAVIVTFRKEAKAEVAQVVPDDPSPVEEDRTSRLAELEYSISRIHEASAVPPLPPSEYRLMFSLIALEVNTQGFRPLQTAEAVIAHARQRGLQVGIEDVSFVVNALDETDPGLEHTRTAAAAARVCRAFVHAKCRDASLMLSDDEYDLIDIWFDGGPGVV